MRHTGYTAIQIAMQTGRPLNKYADPTEGERSWLTVAEAQEIMREDPGLIWIDDEATEAARVLGAKGGAAGRGASKRRDVDYSALGRKGGRPGPSLAAQAAVVWTELAVQAPAKMTLGPRLVSHMLDGESHIGLTPDSAARLVRDRAGRRTSAWITRDARIAGEP